MSKFQHRHYAAIAAVLRSLAQDNPDRGAFTLGEVTDALSRMFARDNAMFKTERFLAAADPRLTPHGKDKR